MPTKRDQNLVLVRIIWIVWIDTEAYEFTGSNEETFVFILIA